MRNFLIILLILILLLFLYCFFVRKGGCCIGNTEKHDTTVQHWISWNLLFTPSSLNTSAGVIQDFENYLTNYAKSHDPSANITFKLLSCPCDTLLTNLDATLVYGSGNSVPPPPTKPNPGPSGDYTLGNNLNMYIPAYLDSNRYDTLNIRSYNISMEVDTSHVLIGTSLRPRNKVLAVIDTGLDTLSFNYSFPKTVWGGNLLWQDAAKPTLFDVVINEPTGSLMDGNPLVNSNPTKHGTAVSEIALTQIFMRNRSRIPQIMSIRAFDDSEKGSIYTVSCALSYAIQHNADYINASWGYFGQEDSILKSYIRKANDKTIRVIAAAGNTHGKHVPSLICNSSINTPNPTNSLDMLKMLDNTLFYPACFAPIYTNLVSVTQLNQVGSTPIPLNLLPCFYQNYSSKYITLGAFEPPSTQSLSQCCTFNIPFLDQPIEGSSFVTPAMTAVFMSLMDGDPDIKSWIRTNATHMTGNPYTEGGSYFVFHQFP